MRADFDIGSVIVKDMVERLAYADLVLADVSLPNGNVYYEVGLRHAARDQGCILFAADWSRQLFDIDQFTAVRYTLKDGDVPDEEAAGVKAAIFAAIPKLKSSTTPWFEYIDDPKKGWARGDETVFRKEAARLSAFQGDLRAIRLSPKDKKRDLLRKKMAEVSGAPAMALPQAAIEMVIHIRDVLEDWQALLDFIDTLDPDIRALPVIEEQRLLALGKTGDSAAAIGHMQALIDLRGETPERLGIIGGRYKQLWRNARDARLENDQDRTTADERKYLNQAISHYEKGMLLDLNEYYCACNVPPLILARAKKGDAERAWIIGHLVVAACERAIAQGTDDEWTRPTLLGDAFRTKDTDKIEDLIERIEDEGPAAWKLETTLDTIQDVLSSMADSGEKDDLADLAQRLEDFLEKHN